MSAATRHSDAWVGIMADSHGKVERVRSALRLLERSVTESQGRLAAVVHCGDLHTPEVVAAGASCGSPFYFVFGNHDADMVVSLQRAADAHGAHCLQWGGILEVDGQRIGVCHGHLKDDRVRLMHDEPNYLFSGHTHVFDDWIEENVRRINPGALFRAPQYTVAALRLATGELRQIVVPKA